MFRVLLLAVVSMSVCASPLGDARAQGILFRCYRSTIESYPEAEKRPLLQYLDGARATADAGLRLVAEGKMGELYEMMSASFREKTSLEELERAMAALERKHGEITSYEYRNQHLDYAAQRPINLSRSWSSVWFAVETTNPKSTSLFLTVRTENKGEGHTLLHINLKEYDDDVPAWLRSPNAPGEPACPWFPAHIEATSP